MQIVNLLKLLIDPENMLSAANVRFLFLKIIKFYLKIIHSRKLKNQNF